MIKEVRHNPKERGRIYALQKRGAIKTYLSAGGYIAYDTDELKAWKENPSHVGRPSAALKERNAAKPRGGKNK